MSKERDLNFLGTARFAIEQKLGSGGFGVVYQVYDRQLNTQVALKVLNRVMLKENVRALARFKREFRTLADLIHPNLVSLYELIAEDEQWFFTMELVNGVDFLAYIRGKQPATSTLNIERLRTSLAQLVEGVYSLHNAGKLHRDIKPSNILVTNEGRVVLLDFGLVAELTQKVEDSLGMVGTPSYMSPEQSLGLDSTEACDWYSVGVMLYEALTGQLPFTGNLFEILKKKQSQDPAAPITINPDLPQDLNQLCVDLLQRDPKQRPNGNEVLQRIGINHLMTPTGRMPKRFTNHQLLVGRKDHLNTLEQALALNKTGQAVIVDIQGQSGIGKSAIVNYFLSKAQLAHPSLLLLTGRCYEQESVPYKALDNVIDVLGNYLYNLPDELLKDMLPRDFAVLTLLFPVLRQFDRLISRNEKQIILDSQELRRRAFGALKELLSKLVKQQTVLLFIDDLQWGDADSRALLSELFSPPDSPALLFIGSYRSEDIDTKPFFSFFTKDFDPTIKKFELLVESLSYQESCELAMILLGERGYEFAAQIDLIAQEADGNPFFIDELTRHLLSNSGSNEERRGNKQPNDGNSNSQLTIKASLEQMILKRFNRLPEAARQLLEVVVVAGQPLLREIAKKIANLAAAEQGALVFLRSRNLIRVIETADNEELDTYHDRIREVIVNQLSPAKLKSLHHQLGLELEQISGTDSARLVGHFQKAADNFRTVKYALLAAERAYSSLAFDRAVAFYQLVLNLNPSEPASEPTIEPIREPASEVTSEVTSEITSKMAQLRARLGDALVNCGRSAEAAHAYIVASADTTDIGESFRLGRCAAEQWLISGHIDEGLLVLRHFLNKVGLKMPQTTGLTIVSLVLRRTQTRLRGLEFVERSEAEIDPAKLLQIDACWAGALGLSIAKTLFGAEFQARHLLLALRAGEPYRVARALALDALYSSSAGGPEEQRTEMLLQRARGLAEKLNNPHALGLVSLISGMAAFLEGKWQSSKELTSQAERLLREQCSGVAWEIDNAELFFLRSLFWLGEIKEMIARLPAWLKVAQERGDLFGAVNLQTRIKYIADLAADEPEKAHQDIVNTLERWSQNNFYIQHYFTMVGKAEIALYTNQPEESWNILQADNEQVVQSMFLYIQHFNIELLHLRARVLIARAVVNEANAKQLIKSALQEAGRIEKEAMPWGNALALIIRASCEAQGRKREKAIELLKRAEEACHQCNMTLYELVVRRRRGELIGGKEGYALIVSSDNAIKKEQIVNPARMSDMLVPGKW